MMQGMPFEGLAPSMTIVSDTLDLGWGALINSNLSTHRTWSEADRSLHINVKELKAIRLACQVFLPYMEGRVIQVLMDNSAAMFYINKQGGARSLDLCQESVCLWNLAIQNSFHIMASHLPEDRNIMADQLSRSFSSRHKKTLHPQVTAMIFQTW